MRNEPISPNLVFDFVSVWSDITDEKIGEGKFLINDLINKLPSIKHLGNNSQRDVIRYVLKSIVAEGSKQVARLGRNWWTFQVW